MKYYFDIANFSGEFLRHNNRTWLFEVSTFDSPENSKTI